MIETVGAPDAASQIAAFVFSVLLIDDQGRIAEANYAAEEMLGRSAQRLVGCELLSVIAPSDERVACRLATGEGPMVARGISLVAAGCERLTNVTSSPLHGRPGWRVVTLSDAGQSGETSEDDRVGLRAPSVLAHEIKNPLSAIRGASQLLARRVEPRDKALTDMISNEVDRIAKLIDRMQQLGARPSTVSEPVNLHEAIRNAMATVRAGRPDAAELVEEFDPSLPAVAADQSALEQVLINLLVNACDASTEADAAQVIVRTRFASGLVLNAIRFGKATRLPIEITVSDRGPGIDPALRDHIFEPFVTSKPHGQGLGLALVRKLLRDMGGRIVHERDARAGQTHFRINLPVAGEGK